MEEQNVYKDFGLVPEEEAEAIVQLENFEEHEAEETKNMNFENKIMIEETIEEIDHDQDLEEVLDETRPQRLTSDKIEKPRSR
ncbi:hypothetical protein JTB14_011742 [Gonioctena quinquepunctata]|nr:hypothetical protein JTB14_011742 [Gonioctena quinquepunctata]